MIAALFDCDGTLFSAQFGRGLIKYAKENGNEQGVRAYYATIMLPHLLRKFNLISKETYQRPLISQMGRLIKGWDPQESKRAFDWVVNEYLLPSQFPEVVTRLQDHSSKGHLIVLVSGILQPVLEIIGEHYDAGYVIGTKIESQSGRYTGQIIPPVITGEYKASLTRELDSYEGLNVEWAESYAYADSITDQALLKLVGHPVAVNPDAGLLNIAGVHGWEIFGKPKE